MTTTCTDCGQPASTATHPGGRGGAAYGVDGRLCPACYHRRRYWATAGPVPPCDLCGTEGGGTARGGRQVVRRDARPFDLEGRLCLECWTELTEERRAGRRRAALEARAWRRPAYVPSDHGGREEARKPAGLEILNPEVRLDDVPPRLACAMILAETKHVFRRATG